MVIRRFLLSVVFYIVILAPSFAAAQTATPLPPSPPLQSATGPGGAEYPYAEVTATHYGPVPDGSVDATGYWIFEPVQSEPTGSSTALPLIFFFHGYYGADPIHYRAWIDHLVRRGAVVVYPDYQPLQDALTVFCPSVCLESDRPTWPLALIAIRSALAELANGTHSEIDLSKVGAVGHSWGGMMTARYAATAKAEGLPIPAAIMPVMPGCECDFGEGLETIAPTTRVLILASRADLVVGERFSKPMWTAMTSVPLDQRDYVRLASDQHGTPRLIAEHSLPATDNNWGPLDAYDWYGTWKLFDALLSCSFSGIDCHYALGNTPEQRFMGSWSDGTPVTEAHITDDPAKS